MTQAMQGFRDAAVARQKAKADATTQRETADLLCREQETAREQTALQHKVVTSLSTALECLAAGDLVFRLSNPFSPEYEPLRPNFNDAITRLQDTMRTIAANSVAIRSGSEEIAQAAKDLSRRTEQQAANLGQMAAALDEITATVRKTAWIAGLARKVVGAANTDAERSSVVVREAAVAMSGIEASFQKISQIIGVIDEIAFQTNLLAQNAGVQAARAGDAGRGFAVVASEVRALAQRSADAAKEIKALISTSSQQVGAGVDLVGQTGQALKHIMAQVVEINGAVTEIATSAQEQATGLAEVNTAVNQMDQMTRQNAAMVEQPTAASQGLMHQTNELSGLLCRFSLGSEADPASPPPHMRSPAAAMRVLGRGGAAQKPELAEPAEHQKEF